ncbi:hypothetical protein RP20_CCG004298 [Aedes albopictus]|nr:hypothetical protein RP20_CCG004298 [Aedes albopictus]
MSRKPRYNTDQKLSTWQWCPKEDFVYIYGYRKGPQGTCQGCPGFRTQKKKNKHHPKRCKGLLRGNGCSLDQTKPKILQYMLQKLLLLLGKEMFVSVDILIRVSGGGHITQVYAIRLSIP